MNELALLSSWEGEVWFAELTDDGRRGVRERGAAIERILKAPRGQGGKIVEREAAHLGIAPSTMRSWVTKFTRSGGDPRSLIDNRAEPHKDAVMPAQFLEFWQALLAENQRADRPAWRKLRALYRSRATQYQWRETSDIVTLWPGYAMRPDPSPSSKDGLPRGWSYSNLVRIGNGLTEVEKLASRQGPIAASEMLDQILTTRFGLEPGQAYVFDDRWFDIKATMPPSVARKPVRAAELSCGDIASAATIAWGALPMIENDEGTQQRLKDQDMRMLLVKVLCFIGYHPGGVTLYVEHGTAAISRELELWLCVWSGGEVKNGEIVKEGLIRVKRSGIKGGKRHAGGYLTLGKGNFRFKASRESNHNLLHNELADLPGQVGKNSRLETVEDDHGRDAEACFLLTAATDMEPSVAAGIKTGYLTFIELWRENGKAIRRINDYIDHCLQGWKECGHLIAEFRLDARSDNWQPMEKLLAYGDVQRAAITACLDSEENLTRTRQLSRWEVWQRGESKLVRLPMHCVPEILGPRLAVTKSPGDDGNFVFRKAGEDDLIYRAVAERTNGVKERLAPGVTYRTWINPYDTSVLFVSHATGGFIGVCRLKARLDRDDTEAFKRQAAESAHVQSDVLAGHYRRAVKKNRAETRIREHNVAIKEHGPGAVIEEGESRNFGQFSQT